MKFESWHDACSTLWPGSYQDTPPAYADAQPSTISDAKGQNMVAFIGPPGTGKTWCAWGLLNSSRKLGRLTVNGGPFAWLLHEADLMAHMWDDHALSAIARWPGMLIIDDIGYRCHADQLPHAWLQHAIYWIANERVSWHLRLMVTTNLDESRLSACYGRVVASRLLSGCVVNSGGDDRRTAK